MTSSNISLLVAPIVACYSLASPISPNPSSSFLSYTGHTGNTYPFSVLEKSSAAHSESFYFTWEGDTVCEEGLSKNLERLRAFGDYTDNWNGYGAPAFSKGLLEYVENILLNLEYQPEIFPIAGGAIQFEYDKPTGEYLEFEISKNEDVHCLMIDSNKRERTFDLMVSSINEVVKNFYGDTI